MPWLSRTDGFMTVHLLMEIKLLVCDPYNPSSNTVKSSDIWQWNVLIFSYVFVFLRQKVVLNTFLELTSFALKLQSSWLQSPSGVKGRNILFCSWHFLFPGIAQFHPGSRRHAADDAGSGLHLHRVHEHQEPCAGEGDAAQRGAACRRHPELGPVGVQVHREHCSACGSLWAHKYPGQGQWEFLKTATWTQSMHRCIFQAAYKVIRVSKPALVEAQ